MKTKNKPLPTTTLITETQFNEAMARYAQAEQSEAELNKTIETEVNDLLLRYEDQLHCLAQAKAAAFDTAHTYCLQRKQQLFARRRSIGTMHAIAGFRLGTPRLRPLKGTNWPQVVEALHQHLPAYVRTIQEPAKDLLLAHRHHQAVAPVLVKVGVQIVQDELFYIESKKAA